MNSSKILAEVYPFHTFISDKCLSKKNLKKMLGKYDFSISEMIYN